MNNLSYGVRMLRVLTSSACNHHCIFCHNEGQVEQPVRHDLDPESFQIVLSSLVNQVITQIQFSGGEPLLNHHFEELVQIAERTAPGAGLGMATNGTLLSTTLCKSLSTRMNNIRINLPSLDPSKYKKIKGNKDLDRVIGAIDMLVSEGAPTGLNVVFVDQTEEEIINLVDFASLRKIDIKFLEWIPLKSDKFSLGSTSELFRILQKLASDQGRLSESARWYQVPTQHGVSRVRVVESFCETRNASACREYSEIRLLPTMEFQPCLISDENNLTFNVLDSSSIVRAFKLASNQLGFCPGSQQCRL